MSNQSIVINERKILDVIDEMCAQSLDPDTHDAWLKVKEQLISNRKALDESPSGVVSKEDLLKAFEKYFSKIEPISYNGVTNVLAELCA